MPVSAHRAIVDSYWDDLLRFDPLLATAIGDDRFDDRLPDPTSEGREERLRVHRRLLQTLDGLVDEAPDAELAICLEIARTVAEDGARSAELGIDRLHFVDHLLGPVSLIGDLPTITVADRPERVDAYVRRLANFGPYLETIIREISIAADDGVTWPEVVVERVSAQVQRVLETPIGATPLLNPIASSDQEARARVLRVTEGVVLPALARYGEAVVGGRNITRPTIGLASLRDGAPMYQACIRRWTTKQVGPAELVEIGREELGRIEGERATIVRRLGFADMDEALDAYHDTERTRLGGRAGIQKHVEGYVARSWDRSASYFTRLPTANCEVRLVEPFREPDYPGATYQAPSPDRAGIYLVNAAFYLNPDARMLHRLATTSFHEANPGHHFQAALEELRPGAPALRRFAGFLRGDAFAEGWGLYSEALSIEMGLFENDYERLGQLDNAALRAARLVVDTGLHAFGWERERAMGELVAAGLPGPEAENEVDRYAVDPAQALCYKVGEIEIRRLRDRYAAGPDGLGRFHDRLLSNGALPLELVDRELARLYAESGSDVNSALPPRA